MLPFRSGASRASFLAGFTPDLRSLAILRAGLALLLLIDALCRLPLAPLLYADSGLLARAAAVGLLDAGRVSLHLANGSAAFVIALTLAQVLAAGALLIGWRTAHATLLCWLLALSACARNPLVVTPGETLALLILFWGLFLPWGARWSVDEARRDSALGDPQPSAVAGGLLLMLVLGMAALGAAQQTLWGERGMLAQALLLTHDVHAPGRWLAGSGVLPLLEALLLWTQLLVLPLALLPFGGIWPRRAALILCLLLALFALATWSSGMQPWIALLAAVLLVDRALWDAGASTALPGTLRLFHAGEDARAARFARLLRSFLGLGAAQVLPATESARAARLLEPGRWLALIDRDERAYLDGDAVQRLLQTSPLLRPLRALLRGEGGLRLSTFLLRLARHFPERLRAAHTPQTRVHARALSRRLLLVLGLVLLVSQLAQVKLLPAGLGARADSLLRPLALDLVALPLVPTPLRADRWMVITGETADGREVSALRPGRAPQYGREQPALFGGARARQYELRLTETEAHGARRALAEHLCRERAGTLARVRIVRMLRPLGGGADEQQVLLRHECAR